MIVNSHDISDGEVAGNLEFTGILHMRECTTDINKSFFLFHRHLKQIFSNQADKKESYDFLRSYIQDLSIMPRYPH